MIVHCWAVYDWQHQFSRSRCTITTLLWYNIVNHCLVSFYVIFSKPIVHRAARSKFCRESFRRWLATNAQKKMGISMMRVSDLKSKYASLVDLGVPLPISLQLQQPGLHAQCSILDGFSISFFWPALDSSKSKSPRKQYEVISQKRSLQQYLCPIYVPINVLRL